MKRLVLIIIFLLLPIPSYSQFYASLEAGYEEYRGNYYSVIELGYIDKYLHIYTSIETVVESNDDSITFTPVLSTYSIGGELTIIDRLHFNAICGIKHECSHRSEEGRLLNYYTLPNKTKYYIKMLVNTK